MKKEEADWRQAIAQEALKPCPFCDDEIEIVLHRDGYFRLIHRCKIIGPVVINGDETPDTLVERWNTRKVRR